MFESLFYAAFEILTFYVGSIIKTILKGNIRGLSMKDLTKLVAEIRRLIAAQKCAFGATQNHVRSLARSDRRKT